MLRLAGLLLSCGALCLALPTPPAAGRGCPDSTILLETLDDVEALNSEGSREITRQIKVIEEGGNVVTYLEEFIKALKSSKETQERLIAQKLQKIQDAGKSCRGWMEQDWEPVEDEDFFENLKYLLKTLNHNAV